MSPYVIFEEFYHTYHFLQERGLNSTLLNVFFIELTRGFDEMQEKKKTF